MKFIDLYNITGRICSTDEFNWPCYGHGAQFVYLSPDAYEQPTLSCVINGEGELCEASISHSNLDGNAYAFRWFNPKYRNAYIAEESSRGYDYRIAWDNVLYTEVDSLALFIYAKNILAGTVDCIPTAEYLVSEIEDTPEEVLEDISVGEPFEWPFPETKAEPLPDLDLNSYIKEDTMDQYPDGSTEVALNIDNDVLFKSLLIAYEKNITFNQYVNDVLLAFIESTKGIDAQY